MAPAPAHNSSNSKKVISDDKMIIKKTIQTKKRGESVNKIVIGILTFLIGYGFPLGAKLTIHNGTPFPIKVTVISTAGLKDHVTEVYALSSKEIMTDASAGVCITKYKVCVKESGMDRYDEDHPNLEVGGLSDCGFRKQLIITALKDKETGNFTYHLSHMAMAAGKLGVHLHNCTDSKIKVQVLGDRINDMHELEPGQDKDVLGGRWSGRLITGYKVWVMPFGEDKYKEKPDREIPGRWIGFNKQLFVYQDTALDGSLTYKFEAEAYA